MFALSSAAWLPLMTKASSGEERMPLSNPHDVPRRVGHASLICSRMPPWKSLSRCSHVSLQALDMNHEAHSTRLAHWRTRVSPWKGRPARASALDAVGPSAAETFGFGPPAVQLLRLRVASHQVAERDVRGLALNEPVVCPKQLSSCDAAHAL